MNRNQKIQRISIHVIALLLIATQFAATAIAATGKADPDKKLDVILVMDSSGSMKKNDPQGMRKPAAKLFVSLLGKGDRASIVSFSDNGYPVAFLTPVKGEANQTRLFGAIEKISTKGVSTNLQGAIEGAQRVLKRTPPEDRQRIIILMTDGKMDMGDTAQTDTLTRQLLDETLPTLKQQNIEIHTIAFTAQSDQTLLKQIADKTGGTFNIANSDKELHDVYTTIFEQNKSPNMLPFNGEKFSIDNAIKEVTIVGSKDSADTVLSLLTPDGRMITAEDQDKKIKWFTAQQFDLITITNPDHGEWQIKASTGKNKAYVITDLKQQLEITPRKPAVNEGVLIKTWLEDKGNIINKPSVLDALVAELYVVTPDKQTHTLVMEPEVTNEGTPTHSGIYTSLIALPETGQYRMRIVASTRTFSREKTGLVHVQATPASASPDKAESVTEHTAEEPSMDQHQPPAKEAEPHQEQVADEPAPETETKEAVATHEGSVETVAPKEAEHDTSKDDNKDTNAKKETKGKKGKKEKDPKKSEKVKDDKAAHDNKPEGTSLLSAILIFFGINILLGGIGAGVYFFIKKKRGNAESGDDDEDAGDPSAAADDRARDEAA